jgi:hypothetical protein
MTIAVVGPSASALHRSHLAATPPRTRDTRATSEPAVIEPPSTLIVGHVRTRRARDVLLFRWIARRQTGCCFSPERQIRCRTTPARLISRCTVVKAATALTHHGQLHLPELLRLVRIIQPGDRLHVGCAFRPWVQNCVASRQGRTFSGVAGNGLPHTPQAIDLSMMEPEQRVRW